MKLRYGTRGSALAVAQSGWLAARLRELAGVEAERVVIQTSGDRFSAGRAPVPEEARPNVKAMFVKEIEDALLAGEIDFAVHSSKDLPGVLPAGLVIAAYPEREDARDAFIGRASSWDGMKPGMTVGTSSLRRRIQLGLAKPGLVFAPMRGNIDTRLRRLAEGTVDAIVLAKAGLRRLGRDATPHEVLPASVVVPAPGQGALAVEARADRPQVLKALAALDHAPTRLTVELERAFLKAMGGGCQTPLGALAVLDGGRVDFRVFWSDLDGKRPVRRSASCPADPRRFEGFAEELARALRADSKTS